MLYGIQLTVLDLVWSLLAFIFVMIVGASARFRWIRSGVLIAFLVIKLGLGFGLTTSAVLTGVESDPLGYFETGSAYAKMFRELVTGESSDFVHNTPFWWIDGSSTDRFSSLTGLFLALTGGSLLGATAIACLFGAGGQLFLFRFFRERFPNVRALYFLPVLFHPSLMLWSGMLLKDSLGIFALGGAVYSLYRLLSRRQSLAFIPMALSIYVIFLFRSFIFLPLAAFALFLIWDCVVLPYAKGRDNGSILKFLYFMAAFGACILVLWALVSRFGSSLIEDRRETAIIFSQIEAGSSFENVDLSLSPRGMGAFGVGVINSLFRPFPWDVTKPIQAAAALENLLALAFIWSGFNCYFLHLRRIHREQFSGVFWGMLFVALIIASGVGLFASNAGTISRYRIPMIPFLMAVPGLALGMADSFGRSRRQFTHGGRPRHGFEMLLKKSGPT